MEKMFTKSDLKTGMMVDFNYSKYKYLVSGNEIIQFGNKKHYIYLDELTDDLKSKYFSRLRQIVAVHLITDITIAPDGEDAYLYDTYMD